MNKRISIHHVGGRAGNCSCPVYPRFERDMVLSLYEADADCLEQIKERNAYLKSEVVVLPYCLGLKKGEATLFINYDLFTSSLLPPNPFYREYRNFANYGVFGRQFDYVLGEVLQPVEKRTLPLVSLDELFREGKLGAAPPDFLSVDTQGSEYDILAGASQVLDETTLAVAMEVEFQPMYAGQKLFGDIYNLLTAKGFLFIGFMGENATYTPARSPISLRGAGIQLHNDALFLRNAETVGQGGDERARCLMLHKLAFLAVTFHQMEIAFDCLRRAEASSAVKEVRDELGSTEYGRFLFEYYSAASRLPAYFPGTFQSEFTFEASRSRFSTAKGRGVRWLERLRDWCVRKPERWQMLKKILFPISSNGRRAAILFRQVIKGKAFWRHPALQWRSGVERVLARYGLEDQQKTLRRTRWRYAPFCEEAPAGSPAAAQGPTSAGAPSNPGNSPLPPRR